GRVVVGAAGDADVQRAAAHRVVEQDPDSLRHRVERRRERERQGQPPAEPQAVVGGRGGEAGHDQLRLRHHDAAGARVARVADAITVGILLAGVRIGRTVVGASQTPSASASGHGGWVVLVVVVVVVVGGGTVAVVVVELVVVVVTVVDVVLGSVDVD